MRDLTPRLQLVSFDEKQDRLPPDVQATLDKISDPLARRVYEEKVRAGIERDGFTIHEGKRDG